MLPNRARRSRSRGGSRTSRFGFTLVELLVVIAIIGILIALLLPAVQAAREAARRSQCLNHMKQAALALQNYHDVQKRFPPMAVPVWSSGGYNAVGGDFRHELWSGTWVTMTLPYMEQSALYDAYDMALPSAAQRAITGTPIATLRCPSDPESEHIAEFNVGSYTDPNDARYAKGNIAANCGGGWCNENGGANGCNGRVSWGDQASNKGLMSSRCDGADGLRWGATINTMKDGTTNTIVLAEILTVANNGDCRGCWASNMGASFSAYTRYTPDSGPEGISGPNAPAETSTGSALEYRDCPVYCDNGATGLQQRCSDCGGDGRGGIAARSYHPGGVNVSMGDASGRFVSETIDKVLYRGLLTIAGDETIGEF